MSAPDRLTLIEARHAEAGGGDGDKGWLIAEVRRLRARIEGYEAQARDINEALNRGDGSYRP